MKNKIAEPKTVKEIMVPFCVSGSLFKNEKLSVCFNVDDDVGNKVAINKNIIIYFYIIFTIYELYKNGCSITQLEKCLKYL